MEQIKKLPKWAQRHISGLKSDLNRATADLALAQNEIKDSKIWASRGFPENKVFIPDSYNIFFKLKETTIYVQTDGEVLKVYGEREPIVVRPRAANVVWIKGTDR